MADLRAQLKKEGLNDRAIHIWFHPWTRRWKRWRVGPIQRRRLRRALNKRGLITPHFTWAEAAAHDPRRTPVPHRLRRKAIKHAWKLERLRHALGDHAIPIVSWFRTPEWNRAVGGASKSQHMNAWATDIGKAYIERVGRTRFFTTARKIWRKGGIGDYPSGAGHVDSRPWIAFWHSF